MHYDMQRTNIEAYDSVENLPSFHHSEPKPFGRTDKQNRRYPIINNPSDLYQKHSQQTILILSSETLSKFW